MLKQLKTRIGGSLIVAAALLPLPYSGFANDAASSDMVANSGSGSDDSPITMHLSADFYFGGLQIGTAAIDSRLFEDHYQMTSTGRGTGIASLFTRGRHGTIEAAGKIEDGTVVPQLYSYTYGTDEKIEQQTQVLFSPDEPVTIKASPDYTEERRRDIPLAEQLGTLDPLSSALFHLTLGANETPCGDTVRIFDGRRRFDLHTSYVSESKLRKSRYNAYEGDAIVCEAVFERIKGFDESAVETAPTTGKDRMKRRSKTYDPATVWLAEIPVQGGQPGETVLMPVKLKAVTSYGTIMVHLRDYKLARAAPMMQAGLTNEETLTADADTAAH